MCVRDRYAFAGRSGAHSHTIARLATFLTIGRGIADKIQHGSIPSGFSGGPALAGAFPPMSPKKDGVQDQKRPWQALDRWIESAPLC
jgi:hypothetical protein